MSMSSIAENPESQRIADLAQAEKLVDALQCGFPDNDGRKFRPVHTFGVGATGYFVASDVARRFCIAEHFQGERRRATVRFSNGSGSLKQRDGWSDLRGLATRFHLQHENEPTDLIAMTLGEFFAPTVETFFEFAKATEPKRVVREPAWRKIGELLQLMAPKRNPYPGEVVSPNSGAERYADANDASKLPVFQAACIGAPPSYAQETYHAVHTFVVVAPDGVRRWVRFTWSPVSGVRTLDTDLFGNPTATPNDVFLRDELRDRLNKSPVKFLLMMSIGEAGDDFNDPSRAWPPHRKRVMMGTLTIDKFPEDQINGCERLSFNPMRLTRGLEPSDDPILRARGGAYDVSRDRRSGAACPFAGR